MEANADSCAAVEGLLKSRHSCRAFLPDAVPRRVIERIAAIAQLTPSWCNTQPWQLAITVGDETQRFRQALLEQAAREEGRPDFDFPAEYTGIYRERRRRCGWQLYDSVGIERGDREASSAQAARNFRFFGAPHVAIISTPGELGVYGAVDCGAYVNNFMLAAQSMGVATIAMASSALHARFVRSYLDIEEGRLLVCGIAFGYEDVGHPANGFRTERADPGQVIRWFGE
ncbi:MAG: nitroreductase [Candidimonas sp.]|jgi:nitroreductase